MKTVYKFCGKYGLETLNNLELKVTQPNHFNDPFEFTPKMEISDPVRYSDQNLEGFLKLLYDDLVSQGKFHGSLEQFQEISNTNRPAIKAALGCVSSKASAQAADLLLHEVSKQMGILCMTGLRDKLLMWGHYCDNSLGLVIGFDSSCPVFRLGRGLTPVHYVEQRVVFDACWKPGAPELDRYEVQLIFRKSADWTYENEFRQIFTLQSPPLVPRPYENKTTGLKTTGYFLPFPPEAIVSVTLSPRVSPECESEVKEILQKPHFSKVNLDRAILNKADFKLKFEAVKKNISP